MEYTKTFPCNYMIKFIFKRGMKCKFFPKFKVTYNDVYEVIGEEIRQNGEHIIMIKDNNNQIASINFNLIHFDSYIFDNEPVIIFDYEFNLTKITDEYVYLNKNESHKMIKRDSELKIEFIENKDIRKLHEFINSIEISKFTEEEQTFIKCHVNALKNIFKTSKQ